MEQIYLACYGSSEENLKATFNSNIIGLNARVTEGELIYLLIKRDGKWTVTGKGNVGKETTDNPFAKPNRFKTYMVNDLQQCSPFAINDICRSELGNSYGLVLRSPKPIKASKFINYLEENFTAI